MTVQEMPHVEFTGEVFATVSQRVQSEVINPNGYADLACRIGVGEDVDGQSPNVDYVVALDGDDVRPRLATLGIEKIEGTDRAHLIVHAERKTFSEDAPLLGVVCKAAMEHAGVTAAFFNAERDSDIPVSTFLKAGAVALDQDRYEFRAA
jgi:hypothetical protein